jgi:hypothetical protein
MSIRTAITSCNFFNLISVYFKDIFIRIGTKILVELEKQGIDFTDYKKTKDSFFIYQSRKIGDDFEYEIHVENKIIGKVKIQIEKE